LTTANRWQTTEYAYLFSLEFKVKFTSILISTVYLGDGGPETLKEMARSSILKNLFKGCQDLRIITELGIKANFPVSPYWRKCNNPDKDHPCDLIRECRETYPEEWKEALMKDESGLLDFES